MRAIDGVADLIARDERRFAPYVKRTLDHAINRKRGFEVAFYAVENHPAIKLLIGEWVKSEMDFPQSEELLAKAILDRERYAIPRENNKVLLGLLTPELQQRLNQTVERVRRQERERPVK